MISSPQTLTSAQRSEFLGLVDRYFGIRDSDYSALRLDHAINRVLPSTTCGTLDELLEALKTGKHARWLSDIVESLTVGETYFLRDAAQISALRDTVLPHIIDRRTDERRLRIWSAGCSTGEEPYTLAILVLEKELSSAWDVLLVGTDVNRESLRVAGEGRYPARSFRATPDHFRDRYFEPAHKGLSRVIEPIRSMTHFAWMNLGAEQLTPPAAELDLIMCRNVTIYFDATATQRLYLALIGALAPGGWLMLGPSDALPADRRELERVEVTNAVLWRRIAPVKAAKRPATKIAATKLAGPKHRRSQAPLPAPTAPADAPKRDGSAELEAGLLALEAGSAIVALEFLRRATFRDPHSALGQFALARAYQDTGEFGRAHAALLQTRRLLTPLAGDAFVPGADSLPVETLRQTIETKLVAIERR
jgi:chemotaxis protein methyltransferase CheR